MTPMIDVTFQLLLFFLLTCEFRESEGNLPSSLPPGTVPVGPVAPPPLPDPIQIRVRPSADRASACYQVTGAAAMIRNPGELFWHLKARQEQLGSADAPVVILPDGPVPWESVVQAFNQAVRAHYTKIGFGRQTL